MLPHPDADYADRLAQSDIIPRVEKENEYHLYDTPLR